MLGTAIGAGLGALGGFLGGSQTPDYQKAAGQYQQQLSGLTQNLQPFIQGGQQGQQQAIDAAQQQQTLGQQQMAHPAALENQLATGFVASPYQHQMQTNLANMMNANAATTGMLGSTSANAALQNQLGTMQNQWMNQYMDRGTQMYGLGTQTSNLGTGNLLNIYHTMMNQGFSAQQISDELQAQGFMAQMQGAMMPTQQQGGITGALGGALGSLGKGGLAGIGKSIAGLF